MNPDPVVSAKGDMFMTMAILPSSSVGTRTSTPNQGVEVGKDRENKVSTAQIILAKKDGSDAEKNVKYKIFKSWNVGGANIAGQSPYTATFEVSREELLTDINSGSDKAGSEGVKEQTYYVFVVANPTNSMTFAEGADVQTTFALNADDEDYWTDNYFLMSNAELTSVTIDNSDMETGVALGTHTTEGTALNLGTVKIQRAMSRFDIDTDTDNTVFTAENSKSTLKDITITLDAVALVNQATVANLFKVTTESKDALGNNTMSLIPRENNTATQWVVSPDQSDFTLPLFGTGATKTLNKGEGALYDNGIKVLDGEQVAFSSLNYDAFPSGDNTWEADNRFTHPNTTVPENEGNYLIWRYCMENTNPYNPENQLNGNSTGVVFRAIMTSTTLPATYDGNDTEKKGKAIYAYNNVFLGDAKATAVYFYNPKASDDDDVYDMARNKYIAAVAQYNTSLGADKEMPEENTGKLTFATKEDDPEILKGYTKVSEADAETLAELDEYLVANDFSIYRPTKVGEAGQEKPVYYCYYVYWNRHNDNSQSTQMGIMEFATVRNNVYKLRVTKIHKLGHPGEPDDDPDTPDPDDPDEKDHLYLQVQCVILPWEVRINDIEF